nr:hypothetical protein [Hymenobacter sp. HDW8]
MRRDLLQEQRFRLVRQRGRWGSPAGDEEQQQENKGTQGVAAVGEGHHPGG